MVKIFSLFYREDCELLEELLFLRPEPTSFMNLAKDNIPGDDVYEFVFCMILCIVYDLIF